jgi:hypothetical protein
MEQVEKKTTTTEQEITDSGVFKLDERGRPIGIKKLAADKSLSKKHFTPCRRGDLQEMIAEIAREVDKYLGPPCSKDHLPGLLKDFEDGFDLYLAEWGLLKDKALGDHRSTFIEKAKKILKAKKITRTGKWSKSLKAHTRKFQQLDTKRTYRRNELILRMHRLFSERLNKCLKKIGVEVPCPLTDINRYLAHILKACQVESGGPVTVFRNIDRAYHRYIEANPGLKSAPQVF